MKYVFQDYNPLYPELFLKEKDRLLSSLTLPCGVEHVGSSAVKGLGGKPIIDILLVADLEDLESISTALQHIGYIYRPSHSSEDHLFLKRKSENEDVVAYHIHLCSSKSQNAQALIRFRDYLVENPSKAKQYGEIKKLAADQANGEGLSYRQKKADFFKDLDEGLKTRFS